MKPNVVLIEVDQMRGDCLGIKGHPIVETPNLDMMAGQGLLFNNAYSAVPTCIAARASILTGLTPKTHGRVGYQDGVDWEYETTLAGQFASAGYHTQSIGKMHVYPERSLQGFHHVILHDGYMEYSRNRAMSAGTHQENTDDYLPWLRERLGFDADIYDIGMDCNSWVARPWPYAEHLHPTNWLVNQSMDFLRRKDPTKPFFLKMSFVRPHSPLDPPQVYYNQYIHQDIPLPPVGDWVGTDQLSQKGLDTNTGEGVLDPRALKRAMAAYYASITHIDHQLGRFLIALRENNVLENTIILFVSDHGDLMGDHHCFRKALPYQGSVSVPFILYDPGSNLKTERGRALETLVELRDIMPTLLDLCGIEIPESVEGRSVKPLVEGKKTQWREYIHGEHSYGRNSNHFLVSETEKFIWYSQTGQEQFFDLASDPQEKKDLIHCPEYSERVDYWRNRLIKELTGREEGYTDGEKLQVGKKPQDCLAHIL